MKIEAQKAIAMFLVPFLPLYRVFNRLQKGPFLLKSVIFPSLKAYILARNHRPRKVKLMKIKAKKTIAMFLVPFLSFNRVFNRLQKGPFLLKSVISSSQKGEINENQGKENHSNVLGSFLAPLQSVQSSTKRATFVKECRMRKPMIVISLTRAYTGYRPNLNIKHV